MSELILKYHPSILSKRFVTVKATHPDSWSELTPKQLIVGASILNGTITDDRIIQFMTSLRKKIINRLSPYQKLRIIELLKFLNDFTPYYEFIIPSIGKLKRPKPRLKNETFGTFIFAETYLRNYERSYEISELDKFIACYYRTEEFKEEDIQTNAELIKNEPEDKKQAIYINYLLIKQYLAVNYNYLFSPTYDSDQKQETTWVDVFDSVVGDDIVSQDEYANLPISTVLRYLDSQIKKSRSNEK